MDERAAGRAPLELRSLPPQPLSAGDSRSVEREIERAPHGSLEPVWTLALVEARGPQTIVDTEPRSVEHWIGVSGPRLRARTGDRELEIRSTVSTVWDADARLALVRGGPGAAPASRALRLQVRAPGIRASLERVEFDDLLDLHADARVVVVLAGAVVLDGVTVPAGAAIVCGTEDAADVVELTADGRAAVVIARIDADQAYRHG